MTQRLPPILQSPGLSTQTRAILETRLTPPSLTFLSPNQLALLETLTSAILPQSGTRVPLAQLIDAALAADEGPGWRYAELPPAPQAYRQALQLLSHHITPSITSSEILTLLTHIQNKHLDTSTLPLSLWLESLTVDLTRFWLAHPATMDLLNFRGPADEALQPQQPLNGGTR